MKWITWRLAASAALVVAVAVGTGAVASSGASAAPNAQKSYQQQLTTYNQAKAAIQRAFRSAVHAAHVTLESSLAVATTSAERLTANQVYEIAIIEAASVRSNALIALGPPPTKPRAKFSTGVTPLP